MAKSKNQKKKNTDHAKESQPDARKLRKSADTIARDKVYINPHLTKGELMVAYELKCQRRQRNQQFGPPGHKCSKSSSGSSNAENTMVGSTVPAVTAETGSFQQLSTDVNTGYLLAATAVDLEFRTCIPFLKF